MWKMERPESESFVYGLIDPNTKELRYVGQTVQGFKRIREHLNKCRKRTTRSGFYTASQNWINKLKENGQCYEVIYLEYCAPEKLDETERFYIEYFKSIGARLLNHQFGGSFQTSGVSANNRKVISERTKLGMNNPETKEKCRQNAIKNLHKLNPIGKKLTEDCKKKISKSQDEKVYIIVLENGKVCRGLKAAAKEIGCTFSNVSCYIRGVLKTIKGQTPKVFKGVTNFEKGIQV